jgi:hypothetical protein
LDQFHKIYQDCVEAIYKFLATNAVQNKVHQPILVAHKQMLRKRVGGDDSLKGSIGLEQQNEITEFLLKTVSQCFGNEVIGTRFIAAKSRLQERKVMIQSCANSISRLVGVGQSEGPLLIT